MQKLTFTNSRNVSINLTSSPFGVTEWEGFSNVEMEIQSQTVPFVDGSVYIDNLLSDRELSVTLAIEDNNNLSKRYELRRQLIKVLNPKLGEGILTYQNNFLQKQIKCIPAVPIFETHNADMTGTPKASLSFTACQPYWEDIDSTLINFSLTEQPVAINEGDIATQVKLRLNGQCLNPRIINISTGSQIGLSGLITEPVEINTGFGQKTIKSSVLGWTNIFGGYLNGIANKGEAIVVVGTDGAVLYSTDGYDWKSQISGTVEDLNGITSNFSFNLFTACGNAGVIVYSTDGKSWSVGTGGTSKNLKSITCSTDRMVAVGEDGVIVTSTDGMNFGTVTSPVETTLNDVIYVIDKFIAVGEDGVMISSSDGLAWSTLSSGITTAINSINYNVNTGDIIIVGDSGVARITSDLSTWETISLSTTENLNSVIYSTYIEQYFIVGDNGTLINGLTEWEQQSIDSSVNFRIVYFSRDLGLNFIAGQGFLTASPNVSDWQTCLSIADVQLYDIVYAPLHSLYIASGTNGYVFISEDGNSWESINIGIDVDIFSLAVSDDGVIIGVGTGGTIIYSSDGRTWLKVVDGIAEYNYFLKVNAYDYLVTENGDKIIIGTNVGEGDLYAVTYNSTLKKFIAVGDSGRVVTSSDGNVWTRQSSNTTETLRGIASNGDLVVVGDSGTIIKSSDAVTWTVIDIGNSYNLTAVTTSSTRTKYVAVGEGGYILTSENGIKWITRRIESQENLRAICYSVMLSQFLAVGDGGTIVISVDGSTWITSTSGTYQNYRAVEYINTLEKYIAVGSRGTIMSSYVAEATNMINLLAPNSDINFNLEVGENNLRVACESGYPYVTIEYKNKYIGV